jgi:hypothetical protein
MVPLSREDRRGDRSRPLQFPRARPIRQAVHAHSRLVPLQSEPEPRWPSPSSPTTCSAPSTLRPQPPETKRGPGIIGASFRFHTAWSGRGFLFLELDSDGTAPIFAAMSVTRELRRRLPPGRSLPFEPCLPRPARQPPAGPDWIGAIVHKHACTLGCEGIVSKRLGSPYRSGRVNHWLKIKNPAAPAVRRLEEED